MAVATVAIWRPIPGRFQDFVARVAQARKIHERLGGKVRVWQTQFGGTPMTLGYVIEHHDWVGFGKFGAAMESDSEWQQLTADYLADPSGELVQSSVISEPPELS